MRILLACLLVLGSFLIHSCGQSPQTTSNTDSVVTDTVPKQRASLAGSPKSFKGKADSLTKEKYALTDTAQQESKTWGSIPEPMVFTIPNGTVTLTISQQTITIVRAPLTTGGYRCYMTVNSYWTTGWGRTHFNNNPGVHPTLMVMNAQQGVLINWDMGQVQTECGWVNHQVFFTRDFDPNVYDLIVGGIMNYDPAPFVKCR